VNWTYKVSVSIVQLANRVEKSKLMLMDLESNVPVNSMCWWKQYMPQVHTVLICMPQKEVPIIYPYHICPVLAQRVIFKFVYGPFCFDDQW